MITLQTSPEYIAVSGDTYTVRHIIRKAGGLWMADKVTGKGGYWRVPNSPDNLAAMSALAKGEEPAPAPEPVRQPAPAQPAKAQAVTLEAEQFAELVKLAHQTAERAADAHGVRIAGQAESLYRQTSDALETLRQRLNERRVERIEVKQGERTTHIDGLTHERLPDLIKSLLAGLHVWLAGPSGSGKTHGAEQAAKALGLTFRLQGAMTMAHELTGFVDASGKYHETPFVATFRNGGLILLDELDAGSNEALLALNAALANAIMCLPSGEIIRAHPDFKCVGAANTFGAGATAEYVGRTRIDAAFLQRFGARLTWGYDEKLERLMSGNEDWAKRVQRARKQAASVGLKVLITPRASQAGAKLIAAGYSPDEAANLTYLADLSPAQRQQIGG